MIPIDEIAVVVPASNEEQLIARCLESIEVAAAVLHDQLGHRAPRVSITVVADACTDATAEIAARFEGVTVIDITVRVVGTVRATGVRNAIDRYSRDLPSTSRRRTLDAVEATSAGIAPEDRAMELYRPARRRHPLDRLWIANTDGDSEVPAHWLLHQWYLARGGVDVIIGTVQPDFDDLTPDQVVAWRETHDGGQAIGHVHGANLGVRASSYLLAGGYGDDAEHEDVSLVERLGGVGSITVATDEARVITSGRQVGRTPGGYAGYLRETLGVEAALEAALSRISRIA